MKVFETILATLAVCLLALSASGASNYREVSALNGRYPIDIVMVDAASQRELGAFPINRSHYGWSHMAPRKSWPTPSIRF